MIPNGSKIEENQIERIENEKKIKIRNSKIFWFEILKNLITFSTSQH